MSHTTKAKRVVPALPTSLVRLPLATFYIALHISTFSLAHTSAFHINAMQYNGMLQVQCNIEPQIDVVINSLIYQMVAGTFVLFCYQRGWCLLRHVRAVASSWYCRETYMSVCTTEIYQCTTEIHTHMPTYIYAHLHAYPHTYMHTYIHICTRTYGHTCVQRTVHAY